MNYKFIMVIIVVVLLVAICLAIPRTVFHRSNTDENTSVSNATYPQLSTDKVTETSNLVKINPPSHDDLAKMLLDYKEEFSLVADFMLLKNEDGITISYDPANKKIKDVYTNNNHVDTEELFDSAEIKAILTCFGIMKKSSSEDISLIIEKTDRFGYSSGVVDFMFRDGDCDYGFSFSENESAISGSGTWRICKNWYTFEYWLV